MLFSSNQVSYLSNRRKLSWAERNAAAQLEAMEEGIVATREASRRVTSGVSGVESAPATNLSLLGDKRPDTSGMTAARVPTRPRQE